jgi:pyruvate kinase
MIPKKKTKIIATIGPASEDEKTLARLLKAGMNIIRMNFSHGDYEEHRKKIINGNKASKKTGIPVAYLQDLGGPKIRIGDFATETGYINLKKGQKFILTTQKVKGDKTKVFVNYSKFHKEVKVGDNILLNDGKQKLKVKKISGSDVLCSVIVGGEISGRRGVNLPESNISIGCLSAKDKKDIDWGIQNKVDFVALSFVRNPEDIFDLRRVLNRKESRAQIIAKIETPQAVENYKEIIEVSDAIMVARGDLAIEVPAQDVPLIQKKIIERCNQVGRPVITATQMLETMIENETPTRAEVSDIANAILDGTDAVMLSGETTVGKFPVKAVELMNKVAESTEGKFKDWRLRDLDNYFDHAPSIGRKVTANAVKLAKELSAKYIISLTGFGYGPRMISRFKPTQPILAFTPKKETFQRSLLNFGTYPIMINKFRHLDEALVYVRKELKNMKLVKKGDLVIVVTGTPFNTVKQTNTIQVAEF